MPSNLLRFDADYVAELTSRMNTACSLMTEAVSSLKSAQNHENWKCKERTRILDEFDTLNQKLGRLDSGVNQTTKILGASVSRFAALENQYEAQAEGLSNELTSNHGYAATVRTDEVSVASDQTVPSSQPQAVSQNESAAGAGGQNPNAAGSAGAAGAAGAASAGTAASGSAGAARQERRPGSGGSAAGAAAGMAGRIPSGGRPRPNAAGTNNSTGTGTANQGTASEGTHNETGAVTAGGVTMNVNLPVTHIPDTPDAAARGIKDTKAVADAAVNMTVRTITIAFVDGAADDAAGLAEAYNAGRSIFENSAVIIAAPMQAHTTERLAMASGLVSLAGSSSTAQQRLADLGQVTTAVSGEHFRTKAQSLMSAVQGNSEAGELRSVLGVLAGSSSESVEASSSGSGKKSFFDMIVEALKKAISGDESGSSSASMFSASSSSSSASSSMSESSPVMEFLNKFVMDQV